MASNSRTALAEVARGLLRRFGLTSPRPRHLVPAGTGNGCRPRVELPLARKWCPQISCPHDTCLSFRCRPQRFANFLSLILPSNASSLSLHGRGASNGWIPFCQRRCRTLFRGRLNRAASSASVQELGNSGHQASRERVSLNSVGVLTISWLQRKDLHPAGMNLPLRNNWASSYSSIIRHNPT
jgi:hypothetical protein